MLFVLVHGSWHDGETFAAVAHHLRSAGHEVHAPTIAGHGKSADKNVDHAKCVGSIVDYISSRSLENVVLLGHSYGGTVISKAVELLPDRIKN